ncbi:MAG: hypothetical protein K2G08_01315 [Paramuribaculum sp.]|nr:hypothetical protein [Paramuribaculum sp.]
MNKTERELFEEEMAKWPEELERRAEERRKKSSKLHEGPTPHFNSIEEADKYYNAIPLEDFIKEWIK